MRTLRATNSFFCRNVRERDGVIDIIGLLNEVVVNELPATVNHDFEIKHVSVWMNEGTSAHCRLHVLDPLGHETISETTTLRSDRETTVLIMSLAGVRLECSGEYRAWVVADGIPSADVPLIVNVGAFHGVYA